ncbi:uncharacterized protein L969DRAFT_46145 [Mixia osmundae IAM 14324]|uniref:Aminotransferase class I/classII large domain-containing protein n=1 Tax=Mixia osmundae (strain CBS 9802 / IAM 14324 / JCM 22182 / KY 12970) TaxID=764103 RepID=G7EAR1_MIXOS|nr:uncharacterized protein L969DRAFT_46145 [Mixia osmundae IAM 14324]KEI40890.1 hypothetical protein L969DRAFT_46145 [Mixia osmundae IAM 14324]GAA99921.1 hypothetical protein E5Q_06624 [Mixia osmundae IAM 14324]
MLARLRSLHSSWASVLLTGVTGWQSVKPAEPLTSSCNAHSALVMAEQALVLFAALDEMSTHDNAHPDSHQRIPKPAEFLMSEKGRRASVIAKADKADDETSQEAHRIFRDAHKNSGKPADHGMPGILGVPSTGVLYVTERATANGFSPSDKTWCNAGQGAPETGPLEGDPGRIDQIDLRPFGDEVHEYAPTTGSTALREAVANLYNVQYRQGKSSQFTAANVAIVPGGRAGLTRLSSIIGDIYCVYSTPEYSAYSDLLSVFKKLIPVATSLREEDAYKLNPSKLREQMREVGATVAMLSNPRNPTGQVVDDEDLQELVSMSEEDDVTLILDEMYSHYMYTKEEGYSCSAARYIDDVDSTNIIIVNGLTKSWRYPSWRCCWIVGSKELISALGHCGSYLDGGTSGIIMAAALPLLEPSRVQQDCIALQRHFKAKRDYVLKRLHDMGLGVTHPPVATFYIWLNLKNLPAPLDSGLVFFEECLKRKAIVVPGVFFDINPSNRRRLADSPCHHFVRISYGPPLKQLEMALDAMEQLLHDAHYHMTQSEDAPSLHHVFGKELKQGKIPQVAPTSGS